jgi:hypothetical protein
MPSQAAEKMLSGTAAAKASSGKKALNAALEALLHPRPEFSASCSGVPQAAARRGFRRSNWRSQTPAAKAILHFAIRWHR